MDLKEHPGMSGVFTKEQADGAIPNGAKIRKRNSEPLDGHGDGSTGTVLGSVAVPQDLDDESVSRGGMASGGFMYFVAWDDMPNVAVGTVAIKVEPAE